MNLLYTLHELSLKLTVYTFEYVFDPGEGIQLGASASTLAGDIQYFVTPPKFGSSSRFFLIFPNDRELPPEIAMQEV